MNELLSAESDVSWEHIAPHLDAALCELSEPDRDAVLLRYFEKKSAQEMAERLDISDEAAQKRVSRAVERLREFFTKRGITAGASGLVVVISANSVQAAPVGLAVTVTAVAKTSAVSGSSLALVKLMAWVKAQTAIVVGTAVVLAAVTTAVVIEGMDQQETYSWQVPFVSQTNFYQILSNTPPQVKIVPTKFPQGVNRGQFTESREGFDYYEIKSLGTAVTPENLIANAYRANFRWIAYRTRLPEKKYDYIVSVPRGSVPAFQDELRRALGLVAKYDFVETNVLLLKLAKPTADGFKPAHSLKQSMGITNWTISTNMLIKSDDGRWWTNTVIWFDQPMETLTVALENYYQQPIVNRTGLTNTYDFSITYPQNSSQQAWRESLLNQFGVELVPSRERIKMLVVERSKN